VKEEGNHRSASSLRSITSRTEEPGEVWGLCQLSPGTARCNCGCLHLLVPAGLQLYVWPMKGVGNSRSPDGSFLGERGLRPHSAPGLTDGQCHQLPLMTDCWLTALQPPRAALPRQAARVFRCISGCLGRDIPRAGLASGWLCLAQPATVCLEGRGVDRASVGTETPGSQQDPAHLLGVSTGPAQEQGVERVLPSDEEPVAVLIQVEGAEAQEPSVAEEEDGAVGGQKLCRGGRKGQEEPSQPQRPTGRRKHRSLQMSPPSCRHKHFPRAWGTSCSLAAPATSLHLLRTPGSPDTSSQPTLPGQHSPTAPSCQPTQRQEGKVMDNIP